MPKSVDVHLDGTNRSLQKLYRAYNRFYFGNQLDPDIRVRFSPRPMKRTYAYYDPETEEIVIDKRFRFARRICCWLLLHEMNHVWAGPEQEHNPIFDGGMFRLASIGALVGLW